jgi:hypothetical protein
MHLIICGSRDCKDENLIEEAILKGIEELGIVPTTVIHGDAQGVDKIAGKICEKLGYNVVKYPAKWNDIKDKDPKFIKENKFGKYYVKAGLDRNQVMADKASPDGALIAITLGTSGTEDMISRAKQVGLKTYVYSPGSEDGFSVNFWDD